MMKNKDRQGKTTSMLRKSHKHMIIDSTTAQILCDNMKDLNLDAKDL